MTYGDFNDFSRRTVSDKVFLKIKKIMDIKEGLLQWFTEFLIKKSITRTKSATHSGTEINSNFENEQVAEKLHKPIISKFWKNKVYLSFKGNICGHDLADMQLISKYNKEIRFLLCVIDFFRKHAWVL